MIEKHEYKNVEQIDKLTATYFTGQNIGADENSISRVCAQAEGKTALIADDDEYFRMALRVILSEQLGFSRIIEASSLDDAIECLSQRDDVSLALFDLAMPGMKRAASLRAVRERYADLRIVVISGSRRREDILVALTNGVNGYIPKSLGPSNIFSALDLVMDGQVYVPELITDLHCGEDAQPGIAPQGALDGLTPRQGEVLRALVRGKSNKEIARILDLGEGTVKVHISALFRSLGTSNRSTAAVIGAQLLGE